MEQTMALGAGLTARQEQLLDLAIREPYFLDTFYLSGGTALSSWYLHHRESYDLDFFSIHPFDYDRISRWFREQRSALGYDSIQIDEDYGFLTARLRYPNNDLLKIDFNNYARVRIQQGVQWRGLEIDSLRDIAVNKIHTLANRPRTRDYVDVYGIFKKYDIQLSSLIADAERKFEETIDALQLVKNFLKVKEYKDLPIMLVPFDRKQMDAFFTSLARSLKKEIIAP